METSIQDYHGSINEDSEPLGLLSHGLCKALAHKYSGVRTSSYYFLAPTIDFFKSLSIEMEIVNN